MRPGYWKSGIFTLIASLGSVTSGFALEVQHGRISYADNDGLIRGSEDADWSIAQLNSLVMPGDTIWADENGILEIEVSGGSFLRLADGSRIDIISMPPSTQVRGWTGSFYLHRLSKSEGEFVFETPVGTIAVEPNSQVRVDILEEGAVTITVRWGNTEVRTTDGKSISVSSGKRVYIDPGYLPSNPTSFDRGQEDGFDTWNRERSRKIAEGANQSNIGQPGSYATPIGAYDLDEYGTWLNVDGSYYWKPTTVVDYVPYRTGSWSYVPAQGHVWVGHHPFTYITSHHGYWDHHDRHGWIWSYNSVYSPAYAATVHYDDRFIWAPLAHHGDAVYLSGSYFTAGGFHFSLGYSTYVHTNHLYGGYHHVNPLHHYGHITNNHYYDAYRWNLHVASSHHYQNRPHRNPYRHHRDYTPSRHMRGPSEVIAHNGRINASERISLLESRNRRAALRADWVSERSGGAIRRTSERSTLRTAGPRRVTFDENRVERIASRTERLRRTPNADRQSTSIARVNRVGGSDRIETIDRTSMTSRESTIGTIQDNRSRTTRPSARETRTTNPRATQPGLTGSEGRTTNRVTTTSPSTRTTRISTEQERIRRNSPSVRQPSANTERITRSQSTTTRPSTRTSTSTSRTTRPSSRIYTSTPRTTRPTVTPQTRVRQQVSVPTSRIQTQTSRTQRPTINNTPRPTPVTPRPTARQQRTVVSQPRSFNQPRTQTRSYSPPSRPSISSPRSSRPAPRRTSVAPPRVSSPRVSAPAPSRSVTQSPRASSRPSSRSSVSQPRSSGSSRSSSSRSGIR